MATSKLIRVKEEDVALKHENNISSCESCGSTNIKGSRNGYVCGSCGLVLSSLVLEYHQPFDVSKVQHSPKQGTQIGFYKERMNKTQSVRLQKWQQLDLERGREEDVKRLARREIKRIILGLRLSSSEVEPVFKQFLNIRKNIRPGTKYRSVEKLVPITIYLHFKLNCKGINEQELLEISDISKKEFNFFKLQLSNYIPCYNRRNRKNYVLQKIFQITEEFGMSMEFYDAAKKIMYKFWEIIKNTKDDVIAGVVCSIVALCDKQKRLKVNAICSHLGIQMSTIQRQVEQNVFNRLRVEGFTSLVKSTNLIKTMMVKLRLIEPEEPILSVIQITLGNASDVYNRHQNERLPITPNFRIVKTPSDTCLLFNETSPFTRGEIVDTKHIIPIGGLPAKVLICKQFRCENPKGPP